MQQEKLILLIKNYVEGTASITEVAELSSYVADENNAGDTTLALEQVLFQTKPEENYDSDRYDTLLKNILQADKIKRSEQTGGLRKLLIRRIAVAASIAALFSLGIYFFYINSSKKQIVQSAQTYFKNDMAPGGNKATLTLSNGSSIILDSAGVGILAQQGNSKVIKLGSGQLLYQPLTLSTDIGYNTISTPKGGQYQVTLPDGSRVWLNAESSITFPIGLTANERRVSITGEAYFEVAHNAARPFIVSKGGMNVKVLGTHFNINAYDDENAVRVTLLEGSVEVKSQTGSEKSQVIIKPGQQAVSINNGKLKIETNVDLEQVMAWKNGRFELGGNTIEPIMRQVARWYDVEIEYRGIKPTDNFMGGTSRQDNVSELLKILESTKAVKFEIDGRKIIVSK